MKRIVSISLGSSTRNKLFQTQFLQEEFVLERRGTDGSLKELRRQVEELDGKADMITLGGIHIHFVLMNGKKIPFRDAAKLTRITKKTPVIDGEAFREYVEPEFVKRIFDRKIIQPTQRILFPLIANRFAMGRQLQELGFEHIVCGDLIYDLGFPRIAMRSLKTANRVAAAVGPLVTKIPYQWVYPTGEKQEKIIQRNPELFEQADILAGDFHNIRRFLIENLKGKVILTNTVTQDDRKLLKDRGLRLLVTFSPNYEGRSFGANVMNGVVLSLLGKHPDEVTREEYLAMVDRMGLEPAVETLNP